MNRFTLSSPIGYLTIHIHQNCLVRVSFSEENKQTAPKTDFEKNVAASFNQYFTNPNAPIELPLQLNGTTFEKKVFQAISQIPVGETRSYSVVAEKLKTGARAVANACRKNPLPLIIPCHRVVGKNNLGGFFGQTTGPWVQIKRWLLQHEARRLSC